MVVVEFQSSKVLSLLFANALSAIEVTQFQIFADVSKLLLKA